MTEAERYLRKARESLASGKADARARRYDSAANRAYYAAFQAAVAALIYNNIRPEGKDWEHRYVMSQFSGKLVWRRELFKRDLRNVLDSLFDLRIKADYRLYEVSEREGTRVVVRSRAIVRAIEARLGHSLGETKAEYEETVKTAQRTPQSYVADLESRIREKHPDAEFDVSQRGPRDFTIEVCCDGYEDVAEDIGYFKADLLIEYDVWIVMITHPRTRMNKLCP